MRASKRVNRVSEGLSRAAYEGRGHHQEEGEGHHKAQQDENGITHVT